MGAVIHVLVSDAAGELRICRPVSAQILRLRALPSAQDDNTVGEPGLASPFGRDGTAKP